MGIKMNTKLIKEKTIERWKKSAPCVVQTSGLKGVSFTAAAPCWQTLVIKSKAGLAWLHKRSKAFLLGFQGLQLFVVLSLEVVDISLTSDVCILGLSSYFSSKAAGEQKEFSSSPLFAKNVSNVATTQRLLKALSRLKTFSNIILIKFCVTALSNPFFPSTEWIKIIHVFGDEYKFNSKIILPTDICFCPQN